VGARGRAAPAAQHSREALMQLPHRQQRPHVLSVLVCCSKVIVSIWSCVRKSGLGLKTWMGGRAIAAKERQREKSASHTARAARCDDCAARLTATTATQSRACWALFAMQLRSRGVSKTTGTVPSLRPPSALDRPDHPPIPLLSLYVDTHAPR